MTRLTLYFSTLLLLVSCNIIDIKTLEITSNPGNYNQIMSANEEILITFNHPMKQLEAESQITISNFFTEEKLELDYIWRSKKELLITPVEQLENGVKYMLSISGSFVLSDGSDFSRDKFITFYYLSTPEYCVLNEYKPENNGTIGVNDSLSFTFSSSIDRTDFEKYFKLTPSVDLVYAWNSTSTIVTINPKDQWEQYKIYSWELNKDITKSIEQHLLKQYIGSFVVQADTVLPELTNISGGTYINEVYTETSVDLSNISNKSVLKLDFNKEVLKESLRSTFKITPDIEGSLKYIDTESWLFIPVEEWSQGVEYNINITTELKDISNNKMLNEVNSYFTPAIIPITISSIKVNSDAPEVIVLSADMNKSTEHTITPAALDNSIILTIDLDTQGFTSNTAKSNFINSVSFEGLFPKVATAPIASMTWSSETQLILIIEGLESTANNNPWGKQTYQLKFKNGEQYKNDDGAYLEEEVYVNFKIL